MADDSAVSTPIAGKTTLTSEDTAVLMKASRAFIGFLNPARMLLYCAVFSLVGAYFALNGDDGLAKTLLVLALAALALAVFAAKRTSDAVGRRYARDQEREIDVSTAGVAVREPGMQIWYDWSRFDRAFEGPRHLVLLAGPGIIVVPKRAFAADDVVRLRELVAAKVRLQPLR